MYGSPSESLVEINVELLSLSSPSSRMTSLLSSGEIDGGSTFEEEAEEGEGIDLFLFLLLPLIQN